MQIELLQIANHSKLTPPIMKILLWEWMRCFYSGNGSVCSETFHFRKTHQVFMPRFPNNVSESASGRFSRHSKLTPPIMKILLWEWV